MGTIDVRREDVNADQYLAEMVRRTNATGRVLYEDGEPQPEWDARTVLLAVALLLIVGILLCGATWLHLHHGSFWLWAR